MLVTTVSQYKVFEHEFFNDQFTNSVDIGHCLLHDNMSPIIKLKYFKIETMSNLKL